MHCVGNVQSFNMLKQVEDLGTTGLCSVDYSAFPGVRYSI
jgi:hypothetical protein